MGSEQTDFIASFRRASAWAVFVMAAAACLAVGLIVYNVLLNNYTKSIQAGIVNLSANALKDGVSADNTEGIEKLKVVVTPLLKASSYEQVTIFDPSGEVVFIATDGDAEATPTSAEDVQQALRGEPVAKIDKIGEATTLHVVAALPAPEGQPSPGVLSGHRPLMLFLEGAVETITLLTIAIIGFAGVAYSMLWYFTGRAGRELARHEAVADALQERLRSSLTDLELQAVGTLQALSAAVDAKDVYTAQHSLNVADYACAVAREMGREDLVSVLERAGLLHDIGKIGVAESILQKAGSLTSDENAAIQEHSRLGANIIETIPFLNGIVPAVMYHHESWDGSGYPNGLSGEEIPLEARILATVDAFDAMTTTRPYRTAMSINEACAELLVFKGSQFDPAVVDALLAAIDAGHVRFRGEITKVRA